MRLFIDGGDMVVEPHVQQKFNAHTVDPQAAEYLPLEPIVKCRQPQGMTYKKLYKHIALGYGQGHGSSYQPWLQIRRKNPSPCSNQVVTWLPPLQRTAHFFSRGEYHTALLLLWLQIVDIREQYPIWPVAHPHPLDDVPNAGGTNFLWSRGLLAIAKDAGIDHGWEIRTRVPYVATIDIAATVFLERGYCLFSFSSKPLSYPDDEIKWRTLERLELERRYAAEINSPYAILSSSIVPLRVAGHLEWWLDCATLPFCSSLFDLSDRFAECVAHQNDLSLAQAIEKAASDLRLELSHAWLLFRHCAWTQKIDIDPSKPILTSYPVIAGGRALRSALRKRLFGEDWT